MNKTIPCWLATLAVTAAVLGSPLRSGAAESGPDKGITTPTETTTPARPNPGNRTTKRDTYPFRGKVASFDATTQSLKLEGKTSQRTVHVTPLTRLTKHGHPALVEDLKPGEVVGGTLRKNAEGHEEALLIRIGPKSGPEVASGTRTPTQPTPDTPPSQ